MLAIVNYKCEIIIIIMIIIIVYSRKKNFQLHNIKHNDIMCTNNLTSNVGTVTGLYI